MRFSKIIFFIILSSAFSMVGHAQPQGIVTSKGFSAEELVKDVFIKGNCKNVSNIQSLDHGLSVGYFEDDSSIFGFQRGIILSSGDVELAEGPNTSPETGHGYNEASNDPDLTAFSLASIFDVGGIEFDFVPVGKTVTFEYAFASEEYCEFVGSLFNDVFGFFVSGPGINGPYANGAINVALVPGTNDFVAINNVNHATNSNFYIKNELADEASGCAVPFAPAYPELIEYDGMTKKLTATIDVIPCETYHIRLLVADVGDEMLDSGVFLGAETLDLTGGDVRVTAQSEGSDEPVAVEGCRNGEFLFERTNSDLSEDLIVYFTINNGSTATSGVDYTPMPDSIIIPAGENSAVLTVEILEDLLDEMDETILLEIAYPCDCIDPVFTTLYISELMPLEAVPTSVEVCAGQSFTLEPLVMGGLEPYSYLWENGLTNNTLETAIQADSIFSVTVTDRCGDSVVVNIPAVVQPVPEAVIAGTATFCDGVEAFLEIIMGGSPPWSFQYTIDGAVEGTVSNTTDNPFLLPVTEAGIYGLSMFSDAQCTGLVSGEALVTTGGNLAYEVTPASCPDSFDGAITWSLAAGEPPASVAWTPPVGDEFAPANLAPGTYNLEVTDSNGCQYVETIVVPLAEGVDCRPYKLYVPNAFSPNNDGINDEFRLFAPPNSNIREVKSLHIFNRWGDLVFKKFDFEPTSPLPLWDGTFKGKETGVGVYAWQVVLELEDGKEVVLSGDLTLIK